MSEQKIMLGELAAEWFCAHAEGKMARNTEVGYRNLIFNHIIPRLGGVALADLSEKRIKSFYRALTRSGLSDRSVWCVHLLLRRILDEACRKGLISENPAWGISITPGRMPNSSRLRAGQVQRYLDAARALSGYPILYVGLSSGLRQGELISLPWAAVDVCGLRVVLKKRWVRLLPQAMKLMVEEHDQHPESSEAFLDSKSDQPYTPHRLYYLHRKVLEQARLPVIGFRQLQLSVRGMEL